LLKTFECLYNDVYGRLEKRILRRIKSETNDEELIIAVTDECRNQNRNPELLYQNVSRIIEVRKALMCHVHNKTR